MNDAEKVVFDVSAHPNLAGALVEVFDSQICGGNDMILRPPAGGWPMRLTQRPMEWIRPLL